MSEHEHDDDLVHAHIEPESFYWKVFGALVLLTVLTVAISQVDLGAWNLLVAVIIATAKASLVVLFFMHLKDETGFNRMLFVGALLFLSVFFVYTMNDTSHRGELDEAYGGEVLSDTGELAPGSLPAEQQKAAAK